MLVIKPTAELQYNLDFGTLCSFIFREHHPHLTH